jgi:hypothetical protein
MLGAGEALVHALPGEEHQLAERALQENISTGDSTTDPRTGQSLAVSHLYGRSFTGNRSSATPPRLRQSEYGQFRRVEPDLAQMNFGPFENAG